MAPLFSIEHFRVIALDQRIKRSLLKAANCIQNGSPLSLTAIGRTHGKQQQMKEKHSIKWADRLLGNQSLQQKSSDFYRLFASQFAQQKYLLVMVDWSTLGDVSRPLLRASIAFQGRAFTLYEEVHPQKHASSPHVHAAFLKRLKAIIPDKPEVIICTDAGFKVPWFKQIAAQGWHWLARTRGTVKCRTRHKSTWENVCYYHEQASAKAL